MREWFQWVLLAAALAVPVLFFWNWRQKIAGPASGTSAEPVPGARSEARARASAPQGGPSSKTEPQPSVAPAGTPPVSTTHPVQADAPVVAPSSPPAAVRVSTSTATQAGPASKAAPKSRITYSPKKDRDPMLSPFELQRLVAKQKEAKEGPKLKVPKKPPEPPIETRIRFSGTMRMGDEIVAYVNDGIVRVGSNVLGARVVKITETSVVFEYKGRRFARTVRQ